jgi:hypothetical protein
VGVPLSTPAADKLNPAGKLPLARLKLRGDTPPLAVKLWLKAVPTVAVVIAGLVTVTVAVVVVTVVVVVLTQPLVLAPVTEYVPGLLTVRVLPLPASTAPSGLVKVKESAPVAVSVTLVLVQLSGPLLVRPTVGAALPVTLTVAVLLQLLPLLMTTVKVCTPAEVSVADAFWVVVLLSLAPAGTSQL